MRTTAAALTCCLLVAALTGAAAVSGTPSTHAPDPSDAAVSLGTLQDSTSTNDTNPETITISIQEDGDARIVLSKSFPTETESQRAAFERLARDFEDGEYGRLGYETFQAVVEDVANETGRPMSLTDPGPATSREGDVGRLEYRFTWTNFARPHDANVSVGDAFATDDGLWLDGLGSGQRLVIEGPDGYTVAESPSGPQIDDDSLIWTGPATFTAGDLQATFEESTNGSTFPLTALLAVLGLVVVGLLAVVGWRLTTANRENGAFADRIGSFLSTSETSTDGAAASTPEVDGGASAEAPTEAGTAASSADADATGTAENVSTAEPDAAADAIDPELLSDGERVEHLLEANGGRMKQANIVSETGWSNAKVSQLLSRLDEEDRVDKLRIGRENLITLPEVDVTDDE